MTATVDTDRPTDPSPPRRGALALAYLMVLLLVLLAAFGFLALRGVGSAGIMAVASAVGVVLTAAIRYIQSIR